MSHIVLEHDRYLRDATYRRKTHAALRRLVVEMPGVMSEGTVIHEDDGSCCRRQPWATTYQNILAALEADGARVLGVVL